MDEMRAKIKRKPDIVAHTMGSDNKVFIYWNYLKFFKQFILSKNLTNGKEVGGSQFNVKTLNGPKDDVGVDSVRSEIQL